MAGRQPYDNQVSIQAISNIEVVEERVSFKNIALTLPANGGGLTIDILPPEGYIYRFKNFQFRLTSAVGATSGQLVCNLINKAYIVYMMGKTPTSRVYFNHNENESSSTQIFPPLLSDFNESMYRQVCDSENGITIILANNTNVPVTYVGGEFSDYARLIFEREKVT